MKVCHESCKPFRCGADRDPNSCTECRDAWFKTSIDFEAATFPCINKCEYNRRIPMGNGRFFCVLSDSAEPKKRTKNGAVLMAKAPEIKLISNTLPPGLSHIQRTSAINSAGLATAAASTPFSLLNLTTISVIALILLIAFCISVALLKRRFAKFGGPVFSLGLDSRLADPIP